MTDRAAGDRPGELEAQVAAVEVARARFGQSLETLQTEARTQVGATVERMLWKVAAAGTAIVAGLTTRKLMDTAWRAARKHDPPRHPEAPGVGWAGAIAWTVATGVGVAVARLVAERGAVAGWRRATGKLPPGVAERL